LSKWLRRAMRPVIALTANLFVAACGMTGAPMAEYVLGTPPPAVTASMTITALPIVEVKPTRLPDYLDTKSLFVRRGNELKPSATGRWGERLSVGLTRAVAASLAARLPNAAVTTAPPVGSEVTLQVLIDVDAFEATAEHDVVLAGTWTISSGSSRIALTSERFSIGGPIAGSGDSAAVAAMTKAVEDLAGQIVTGVQHSLPRRPIK